jgi:2-iminobutanoate/2-iminopropanoate deaminase
MNAINPKSIWAVPGEMAEIYSHAIEVSSSRLLFISGQIGIGPDGSLSDSFAAQAEQAITNTVEILASAGMSADNIVKLTYFITDADDIPTLRIIRQNRWATKVPPAVTLLVVSALASPEYKIEIEAIASALEGRSCSELSRET